MYVVALEPELYIPKPVRSHDCINLIVKVYSYAQLPILFRLRRSTDVRNDLYS